MNRQQRRAAIARGEIARPTDRASAPRICLSLIVRDEETVIERCIRSCMPLIDSWCIVDTGSVDKTMDVIRDVLKDVPGQLLEEPWHNFGYNKSHALQVAKPWGEFALLMDADDELVLLQAPKGDFKWPIDFSADSYDLRVAYNNLEYDRPHLVRLSKDFYYEGVRHEYLTSKKAFTSGGRIEGILYNVVGGGARSRDPQKYLHDAKALEQSLETDPDNARTLYYIGQSYRDAGLRGEALEWFSRRGAIVGWPEETFMAIFEAAKCHELLGHGPHDVIDGYFRAWEARPTRAEPLYELARYLRVVQSRFSLAYEIAKWGSTIARPNDKLFVAQDVYDWRLLDEMAVAAFYIGKKPEGAQINRKLLSIAHAVGIPDGDKRRILGNLAFCLNDEAAGNVVLAASEPSSPPASPDTSPAPEAQQVALPETQSAAADDP
jgi:hypothetical protein